MKLAKWKITTPTRTYECKARNHADALRRADRMAIVNITSCVLVEGQPQ